MRVGLLVSMGLGGCGFLFSGFDEYCEERADCLDANEEDEKACAVDIQNTRRIARVYGCEDDYTDYIECMKEEADCESQGRYDYWTDRGECENDLEDWLDCLADESDVIGGSSSDWDDTGGWDYEVEEEEEETWADSCSFGSDICIEPNEGDNEAWCDGLTGTYSSDPCADGYTGRCLVYAGGDYTYEAYVYYYNDVDGESACSSVGGTYFSN